MGYFKLSKQVCATKKQLGWIHQEPGCVSINTHNYLCKILMGKMQGHKSQAYQNEHTNHEIYHIGSFEVLIGSNKSWNLL